MSPNVFLEARNAPTFRVFRYYGPIRFDKLISPVALGAYPIY